MLRRTLATLLFAALVLLALAVPALAGENGEGLVGETSDKMVTFFSLGMVAFFPILISILSFFEAKLEKRQEDRKAAQLTQRAGW
jgi:hypothetical protein